MNCVIYHWPMAISLNERDKIEKYCDSLNFNDFPSESEVINIFNKFYSNASQYKFSRSYYFHENSEKWFVFSDKYNPEIEFDIVFCKHDVDNYAYF